MEQLLFTPTRRCFFQSTAASALIAAAASVRADDTQINVFGPRPGYSPQIGILVSQMAWMRRAVVGTTKGMTQAQLDFLLDNKANRIGALLLHLAATEKAVPAKYF